MDDRDRRNRVDLSGSKNANARLNEEAVKVIKWFCKHRYYSGLVRKLAKLYKVKETTIYSIKNNHKWSHIKV